ncbi:hypothetical protein GCM10011491_23680 [Brucella endophytica]|uniref:DUF5623 domain-containing protein n=1 Tax=Brucella endophytica TaxID=1963359 RepID=A0A916SDD9_9HYPH|nr:DUF5623 domain-containing protein [Brucella endophytica]GGA94650.1 hypothetical protein GCM10011491_23680 [Brucella endophytica]
MSTTDVRPSSIEGIKRLAKAISKRDKIKHSQALDQASKASGFANFTHARRSLIERTTGVKNPEYAIYISTYWRDGKTRASGRETIRMIISKPLDELIKPAQYRHAHKLGRFRRYASDHVVADYRPDSADVALAQSCGAARVLQFLDATGLRPSNARVEPRGRHNARLPGHDHGSVWYDPIAKHHVAADEPYAASVRSKKAEREAWAREHNWSVVQPSWKGMYYPEGGSELYLVADASKGYSLEGVVDALQKTAPPIVPDNCDRVVFDSRVTFETPGEQADAASKLKKAAERKTAAPRGPSNSVGYRLVLGGHQHRPKATMPVELHAEVGGLLKNVLVKTRERAGVYRRIDSVRSELDDWVQCEHDRKSLSDAVFFDLYYHEEDGARTSKGTPTPERHIESLERARKILTDHYPDCAPLRSVTKKIGMAIGSLQAML